MRLIGFLLYAWTSLGVGTGAIVLGIATANLIADERMDGVPVGVWGTGLLALLAIMTAVRAIQIATGRV